MDLSLSEKQEILLYKACKDRGGKLSIHLARSTYSSDNSAKSAIDKLKMMNYIEQISPGYWQVKKVTDDIKAEIGQRQDSSEQETDGAEYEIA